MQSTGGCRSAYHIFTIIKRQRNALFINHLTNPSLLSRVIGLELHLYNVCICGVFYNCFIHITTLWIKCVGFCKPIWLKNFKSQKGIIKNFLNILEIAKSICYKVFRLNGINFATINKTNSPEVWALGNSYLGCLLLISCHPAICKCNRRLRLLR